MTKSARLATVSRSPRSALPRVTLALLACGLAGFASAGMTTTADSAPALTVKYDPAALQTESGARVLYARLEDAASQLYPLDASSPHFVSTQVRELREQAVARAIKAINNPKLAAVSQINVKSS